MPPTLHLARTDAEREAVFRLRYEIYVEELGINLPADHGGRRMPDAPGIPCQVLFAADGEQVVGTLRMQLGCDGGLTAEDEAVYCFERFSGVTPREQMAVLTR